MTLQARHAESGGGGTAVTPPSVNPGVCVRGTGATEAAATPVAAAAEMLRAESAAGNASQSVERTMARAPPAPEVVAEVTAEKHTAAKDYQSNESHGTDSVAVGNSFAPRRGSNVGVQVKHELLTATAGAGVGAEAHLARAVSSALTKLAITPTPAPPATPRASIEEPPAAAPPPLHASTSNPAAWEAHAPSVGVPFPHAHASSYSQTAPVVPVSSIAADTVESCSAAKAEPVPGSSSAALPRILLANDKAAASTVSAVSSTSATAVTSVTAEARSKISGNSVAIAVSAANAARPPPPTSVVTGVQQQPRAPVTTSGAPRQPPPPSGGTCGAIASATEETRERPIALEVTFNTPPQGHPPVSAAAVGAAGSVSAEPVHAGPQHSFAGPSPAPSPAVTLVGRGSMFAGAVAAKVAAAGTCGQLAGRAAGEITSAPQQPLSTSCCAAPGAATSTSTGQHGAGAPNGGGEQQGKVVAGAQSTSASRGVAVAGAQSLQANGPPQTTARHGVSAAYSGATEGGTRTSVRAGAAIGGVCGVIASAGNARDSAATGRRTHSALAQALPLPPPPPGYVRAMTHGAAGAMIMGSHRGGLHCDLTVPRLGAGVPMKTVAGGGGVYGGAESVEGGAPIKENTGRWTYEEHRLFLRGLELHGKGWKKIASLIKTRTVVQIRTHAQKYFQKVAKAKLNGGGEHGEAAVDSKGNGSRRKSRGRRRMEVFLRGATGIAPSLQPYVAGAGGVEAGLYRFLSPMTIQDLKGRVKAAGQSGGGGTATVQGVDGSAATVAGSSQPMGGNAAGVGMAAKVEAVETPAVLQPRWFHLGRGVDDLLNEAESLDWLKDSGGGGDPATAAAVAAAAVAAAASANTKVTMTDAKATAAEAAAATTAASTATASSRPNADVPVATTHATVGGAAADLAQPSTGGAAATQASAFVIPRSGAPRETSSFAEQQQQMRVPPDLPLPSLKRARSASGGSASPSALTNATAAVASPAAAAAAVASVSSIAASSCACASSAVGTDTASTSTVIKTTVVGTPELDDPSPFANEKRSTVSPPSTPQGTTRTAAGSVGDDAPAAAAKVTDIAVEGTDRHFRTHGMTPPLSGNRPGSSIDRMDVEMANLNSGSSSKASMTAAAAAANSGGGDGTAVAEAARVRTGCNGTEGDVEMLRPSDLQGSDAGEEERLSGLSDLEGMIEDQELTGAPPFGSGSCGGTGGGMDEGMDEDAFVAALLDA